MELSPALCTMFSLQQVLSFYNHKLPHFLFILCSNSSAKEKEKIPTIFPQIYAHTHTHTRISRAVTVSDWYERSWYAWGMYQLTPHCWWLPLPPLTALQAWLLLSSVITADVCKQYLTRLWIRWALHNHNVVLAYEALKTNWIMINLVLIYPMHMHTIQLPCKVYLFRIFIRQQKNCAKNCKHSGVKSCRPAFLNLRLSTFWISHFQFKVWLKVTDVHSNQTGDRKH